MKRIFAIISLLSLALVGSVFAKDKVIYQVGIFTSNTEVADTTLASGGGCGIGGCTTGNTMQFAHNISMVKTSDGVYGIASPVSVGGGILVGMMTGSAPTLHKQWFMDNLHEGDKVLFNAKCDKHNRCVFILPNPDDPNKVYKTVGTFYPSVSKTNANVLCGTGKLTPDVEAQVCKQEVAAVLEASPSQTVVPQTTAAVPEASPSHQALSYSMRAALETPPSQPVVPQTTAAVVSVPQPAVIDLTQLAGKRVRVLRIPLCQPGTYTVNLTYAGKQATVLSAKKSTAMVPLSPSMLDKMPPASRAILDDLYASVTLLLRFDDGVDLDTCAPIGPRKLSDSMELVEDGK